MLGFAALNPTYGASFRTESRPLPLGEGWGEGSQVAPVRVWSPPRPWRCADGTAPTTADEPVGAAHGRDVVGWQTAQRFPRASSTRRAMEKATPFATLRGCDVLGFAALNPTYGASVRTESPPLPLGEGWGEGSQVAPVRVWIPSRPWRCADATAPTTAEEPCRNGPWPRCRRVANRAVSSTRLAYSQGSGKGCAVFHATGLRDHPAAINPRRPIACS